MLACGPDPDDTVADRARAAAVGVDTTGCPENVHGSGLRVSADLVITAAHVVAGATAITLSGPDGTTTSAIVVDLDPVGDVAVLRATSPSNAVFGFSSAGKGEAATIVVSRATGIELLSAKIVRPVTIRTEDIYLDHTIERPGYELAADIIPGDSGGAVIVNGTVAGLVWSRSRVDKQRGWAVDASELAGIVAGTVRPSVPADTRCP